jgi:hypothetical protein
VRDAEVFAVATEVRAVRRLLGLLPAAAAADRDTLVGSP